MPDQAHILRLRSRWDGSLLAVMSWSSCHSVLVSAVEPLRADLERFVADGLHEWVADGYRTTLNSAPEFLERLSAWLERNYNMVGEIHPNEVNTGAAAHERAYRDFQDRQHAAIDRSRQFLSTLRAERLDGKA